MSKELVVSVVAVALFCLIAFLWAVNKANKEQSALEEMHSEPLLIAKVHPVEEVGEDEPELAPPSENVEEPPGDQQSEETEVRVRSAVRAELDEVLRAVGIASLATHQHTEQPASTQKPDNSVDEGKYALVLAVIGFLAFVLAHQYSSYQTSSRVVVHGKSHVHHQVHQLWPLFVTVGCVFVALAVFYGLKDWLGKRKSKQ